MLIIVTRITLRHVFIVLLCVVLRLVEKFRNQMNPSGIHRESSKLGNESAKRTEASDEKNVQNGFYI